MGGNTTHWKIYMKYKNRYRIQKKIQNKKLKNKKKIKKAYMGDRKVEK